MTLPFLSAAAIWAPASLKLTLILLAIGKATWNGVCVGTIIARFFPIRADESEIRGRNVWGFPARLNWNEIVRAEPMNWWGAPYVRLSSATRRRCLWLPLFLAKQNDFQDLLARSVEIEHPLRAFFEARG